MPKTPKEMERLIQEDGWKYVRSQGSHRQYRHATKPGTVTIPFHCKDLSIFVERSIMKQAGLL